MQERIRFLDGLRGFAILGILPANIALFGLPTTLASEPAPVTGGGAEAATYALVRGLFDYKFITIFALLFGAGLAIVRRRASARDEPSAGLMVRRLLALGFFGALHATLLWYGDIVFCYAAIGLVVVWASTWSAKRLEQVGVGLIALPAIVLAVTVVAGAYLERIPIVITILAGISDEGAGAGYVAGSATASWMEFVAALAHWGPALEREVYLEGSFARVAVLRTITWGFSLGAVAVYFGARIAGLFLVGMAAVKRGWLTHPQHHRRFLRRLLIVGVVFGVPLQIAAVVLSFRSSGLAATAASELSMYIASLELAAVIVAAAGLTWDRVPDRIRRSLEAVGRTAFSNYLLQSVLCTWFFYGYGLGLGYYGQLSRVHLLAVVAAVWVLQLIATWLWTRRFAQGPVELAWRGLASALALRRSLLRLGSRRRRLVVEQ